MAPETQEAFSKPPLNLVRAVETKAIHQMSVCNCSSRRCPWSQGSRLLTKTWKHKCPLWEFTHLLVRSKMLPSFCRRQDAEGCLLSIVPGLLWRKRCPPAARNTWGLPTLFFSSPCQSAFVFPPSPKVPPGHVKGKAGHFCRCGRAMFNPLQPGVRSAGLRWGNYCCGRLTSQARWSEKRRSLNPEADVPSMWGLHAW